MKTPAHILAGIPVLALSPVIGWQYAAAAAVASVAIDVDHLSILVVERAYSWKKISAIMRRIHEPTIEGKTNRAYVDILYLFHTVEFNILLGTVAIALNSALLLSIVGGLCYHVAWDAFHHSRNRLPVAEWLFGWNWVKYQLKNRGSPSLAKLSD